MAFDTWQLSQLRLIACIHRVCSPNTHWSAHKRHQMWSRLASFVSPLPQTRMHLKCPLVIGFHLLAHIVLFFCVSNGLLGASLWVVSLPWYSQGIHLHSQCTTHPLNISMFGNVYSISFLFFRLKWAIVLCTVTLCRKCLGWWTTQQKVKQKCTDGCALWGAGQTVRNVFAAADTFLD